MRGRRNGVRCLRRWLFCGWLTASTPFGRIAASAATLPPPAFAAGQTDPFGLLNVSFAAAPSFVDIDGDGALDAFVAGDSGHMLFLRNTGTRTSPAFGLASSDPFGFTFVGFPRPVFADLDGDGDLDALIGNKYGTLIFFRNTGTATSPAFQGQTTNPFGLKTVKVDATPAFVDLDGDGDLDSLTGDDYGNMFFARNTGTVSSPAFASPTANPFGLADVGFLATPTFVDVDGDGDFDAFVGEATGNTIFFENTGDAISPAFRAPSTNPFGLANVGYDARPMFADIDGDGDIDAFVGDGDGDVVFFESTQHAQPSAVFLPASVNPFGLTKVTSYAAVTWIDIDGNGRGDLFVGSATGETSFFRNTGSALGPAFSAASADPFGFQDVGNRATPAFADLDANGRIDAFVGEASGTTFLFRNTGTAASPAFAFLSSNPFGLSTVGAHPVLAFADLDGDGDLDLLVGVASGDIWRLANSGTATSPAFGAPAMNALGLANVGSYAAPALVDIDGDGDLDGVVWTASGGARLFVNTGSAVSPSFVVRPADPFGASTEAAFGVPTFADLDDDGDLDALVGDSAGDTVLYLNVTRQLMFEDGFETGTTSEWSLTSP